MRYKKMLTRREMLTRCSTGFGMLALQGLMSNRAFADAVGGRKLKAKAKHVILCYMSGGVSQVDSFDPKPKLRELHGKPMPVKVERTQFNRNGNVMASPFEFKKHGQSGLEVSSMFPQLSTVADELAVIRSMTSKVNEHAQGNYAFHTGFPFMGHPSAGAWVSYGLGTENQNMPGFVVLQSGGASIPHGGVGLFSNGYLPAENQGSIIVGDRTPAVRNIRPGQARQSQRARLDFVKGLDQKFIQNIGGNNNVEAAVRNYETAFRMQSAVPELCGLEGETEATKKMYGMDSSDRQVAGYGLQCLLARRLVERGVRFIDVEFGGFDWHNDNFTQCEQKLPILDQALAALLQDLESRGLLESTLVVVATEFGRTPKIVQERSGRNHFPKAFSYLLAGGGVQGGQVYGQTDETGSNVVKDPVSGPDFNSTIGFAMGVPHDLTLMSPSRRPFKLGAREGKPLTRLFG